ncbi:MAG: hypothetical protein O3A39_06920 [Proteobacteria bacterium]|nr:hypothetical protein [Pseudomonadota bacterium]
MQECTPRYKIYPLYNTHYDCLTGGFLRGLSTIRELGTEEVNNRKIYFDYTCQIQESI